MKVLFVNALIGGDFSTLDVSVTLLASIINYRTDHSASIADTTFHRSDWKRYIIRSIRKEQPDIIAFSCNTLYMQYVERIATFLKKRYDIPIICGGYHTSVYPQETIKLPYVDAILIGDGDMKLPAILDHYEKNRAFPEDIKGFWVKKDGKIINTGNGDFTENIDDFPHLDWDLWEDLDKYLYYLQMIYFVGNRGCPYSCPFCEACEISQNVDGRYFRQIDPKRYAQEIVYQWERYKKRGMKLAQLFDPVPTMDLKWLKAFCDEYRRLVDPKTHPFSMFSRIDNMTEQKLRMLSAAGCKILRFGIEAGDEKIREEVHRKGITTKDVIRIADLTHTFGITMTAYYILGAPGETRKTIEKTEQLARRVNASRTAFFIYKPITKESMKLVRIHKNKVDKEAEKKVDNLQYGAVINLSDINIRQIERMQVRMYTRYLSRKVFGMIREEGIFYFSRMAVYIGSGLLRGLNIKYLMPYYHIYGYDHITK